MNSTNQEGIASQRFLWQARSPMSKARPKPVPAPEPDADLPTVVAELNERCDHLAQQLRVQTDILEEIRSELQYLVTNGIEIRDASSFRARIPVLKGMALDPIGDDWGDRLDINHGLERTPIVSVPNGNSPEPSVTNTEPQSVLKPQHSKPTADTPAVPKEPAPRGRLF